MGLAIPGPTRGAFVAVHAAAVVLALLFVVIPIAGHFSDRAAGTADDREELRRLAVLTRQEGAAAVRLQGPGDPFLTVSDGGIGSADLQSILQSAARGAGLTFLGVRSIPPTAARDLRLVAARIDVEGSQGAASAMLRRLEQGLPVLRVVSATLRQAGEGPSGSVIHAEFSVEAALKPPARTSSARSSGPDGPPP